MYKCCTRSRCDRFLNALHSIVHNHVDRLIGASIIFSQHFFQHRILFIQFFCEENIKFSFLVGTAADCCLLVSIDFSACKHSLCQFLSRTNNKNRIDDCALQTGENGTFCLLWGGRLIQFFPCALHSLGVCRYMVVLLLIFAREFAIALMSRRWKKWFYFYHWFLLVFETFVNLFKRCTLYLHRFYRFDQASKMQQIASGIREEKTKLNSLVSVNNAKRHFRIRNQIIISYVCCLPWKGINWALHIIHIHCIVFAIVDL